MIQTRILALALLGSFVVSGCARRFPETEPADIPRGGRSSEPVRS
jgi:hypothetical protein